MQKKRKLICTGWTDQKLILSVNLGAEASRNCCIDLLTRNRPWLIISFPGEQKASTGAFSITSDLLVISRTPHLAELVGPSLPA